MSKSRFSKNNENFEKWLSTKLQNKIGNKLGRGIEGSVYEYGNNDSRVIKISSIDAIHSHLLLNKNIKGIVKIYHIGYVIPPQRFIEPDGKYLSLKGDTIIKSFADFGKTSQKIEIKDGKVGYVIMERLDTSDQSSVEKARDYLHRMLKKNRILSDVNKNNVLESIFTMVGENYDEIKNILNNDTPKIVYELLEVFNNIFPLYPTWSDIHPSQFGRNKKNELVAFDISNESHTNQYIRNTIIKESISSIVDNKFMEYVR